MNPAYFLTGTDTEIGKTFVTCALLHRARLDGLKAAGLKPIAAGTDATGLNDDVEAIRNASSVELPREIVNPYCFGAAVAPHIAAAEEGRCHRVRDRSWRPALQARQQADLVIVEGVGGFCVPLGANRGTAMVWQSSSTCRSSSSSACAWAASATRC
jgi:dethiobiotin synthetase